MSYEITVEKVNATSVAVVAETLPRERVGEFIGRALGAVMAQVAGSVVGPPIARFDIAGDDLAVEAGFPVPPGTDVSGDVHLVELPAGDAAQTVYVGPYDGVVEAYRAVDAWFAANGYRSNSAPWETYFDQPGVANPRTLLTWPCAKT